MAPNPVIVTDLTSQPPQTTIHRSNNTGYPTFLLTLRFLTWLTETAALIIQIYYTATTKQFPVAWIITFLALSATFFMDGMEMMLLFRAIRKHDDKTSYKLMVVVDIGVITLLVIAVISMWTNDQNSTTILVARLFFDLVVSVLLLHVVCLAAYIFGRIARRAREPIDPMDEWNYVPPQETYRFA